MRKSRKKTGIQSGLPALIPQAQAALNRADHLVVALADTATQAITSLQKQTSLAIEGLRLSLEGLSNGSLDSVQDAAKSAIGHVRKHPWQSAAVAVGVGAAAVAWREGSRRLH